MTDGIVADGGKPVNRYIVVHCHQRHFFFLFFGNTHKQMIWDALKIIGRGMRCQ